MYVTSEDSQIHQHSIASSSKKGHSLLVQMLCHKHSPSKYENKKSTYVSDSKSSVSVEFGICNNGKKLMDVIFISTGNGLGLKMVAVPFEQP